MSCMLVLMSASEDKTSGQRNSNYLRYGIVLALMGVVRVAELATAEASCVLKRTIRRRGWSPFA